MGPPYTHTFGVFRASLLTSKTQARLSPLLRFYIAVCVCFSARAWRKIIRKQRQKTRQKETVRDEQIKKTKGRQIEKEKQRRGSF